MRLSPGSFNGATTSRSWIPMVDERISMEADAVSMGPQPLGHGYQWLMSEYPWRRMRFQWGHNLSVMDTSSKNTPRKTPTTREFQWGHNLSVMDTRGQKVLTNIIARHVSMGPQPLGHGYSSQMHDFVSRSLSFDENATILHLPSRVALRFPSPFCTFDSRFCERSPFERQFGNVLSHT